MAKSKKQAARVPKAGVLQVAALDVKARRAFDAKLAGRAADDQEAYQSLMAERLDIEALRKSKTYKQTPLGRFENLSSIRLRWVASDRKKDYFEFIPKATNPFAFVRKNGERIEPRRMFTDGGSIPRALWGVQGFSPWGQGPAFLVHDFQFDEHHCRSSSKTFEEVRDTMMEAVKTLMEGKHTHFDESTFYWIAAGISSDVARKAWDRAYPTCPLPPNVAE